MQSTESDTEPLVLNVGGQKVKIPRDVITQFPESALEAIFSGRHEIELVDGAPFIDRDPKFFKIAMIILTANPP